MFDLSIELKLLNPTILASLVHRPEFLKFLLSPDGILGTAQ
jgi:hypothetical protein